MYVVGILATHSSLATRMELEQLVRKAQTIIGAFASVPVSKEVPTNSVIAAWRVRGYARNSGGSLL